MGKSPDNCKTSFKDNICTKDLLEMGATALLFKGLVISVYSEKLYNSLRNNAHALTF